MWQKYHQHNYCKHLLEILLGSFMGILFIMAPENIVRILKMRKNIKTVGINWYLTVATSISLLIILFIRKEKGLISCKSQVN